MLAFRNDKDVRRFGRWILHLSLFKFKVHYTKRVNKVAHSSGMFERQEAPYQEDGLLAMIHGLPLVQTSLGENKGRSFV
jgi:hypothetical protein